MRSTLSSPIVITCTQKSFPLAEMETSKGHIELEGVDGLLKFVGVGFFQVRLQVIMSLIKIPQHYMVMNIYFSQLNPSWSCVNNSSRSVACPTNETLVSGDQRRCDMPRNAWVYTKPHAYSIVTTYDLSCDREWYIYVCASSFFLGWGVGSFIFGWIGDNYGRRKVLLPALSGVLVVSAVSVLSPNVFVFIAFRFIVGILTAGVLLSMVILAAEFVGPEHRPITTIGLFAMSSISEILQAVQAMYVQNWRYLTLMLTLPYLLLLLSWKWIPESGRWLHAKGHGEKAIAIFTKISKDHGRDLPSNVSLKPISNAITSKRSNICSLFSSKEMGLKTISLSFGWLAGSMGYYGIALAARDLGGSNVYVNFIAISTVGIPAVTLAIVGCKMIGRKRTIVPALMIGGMLSVLSGLLPSTGVPPYLRLVVGVFGRFFFTISFIGLYTWSAELYPTLLRSVGMGFSQVMSRIGGIATPWIANGLRNVHPSAPFVVLGGIAIVGGLVMLHLPETKEVKNEIVCADKVRSNPIIVNQKAVALEFSSSQQH